MTLELPHTTRPELDYKRRLARAWRCTQCRAIFTGREAKTRARDHQELTGHRVVKGGSQS